MSIKFSKVMIRNVDVTCRVSSIYETKQGYRVCFQDGGCSFNKSDVNIFEVENNFDITKHEIAECGYVGIKHDKNLYVKKSGFTIDKERAVAIAKALGVTGEDLK